MSKKSNAPKSKKNEETQLLALLKKVLPKATHDPELAGKIYEAIVAELRAKNQATSFVKFCDRIPLPDLEPKTLDEVKLQFAAAFSEGDVTISPNKKEKSLAVEVVLPDGSQFTKEIKVRDVPPETDGEQAKLRRLGSEDIGLVLFATNCCFHNWRPDVGSSPNKITSPFISPRINNSSSLGVGGPRNSTPLSRGSPNPLSPPTSQSNLPSLAKFHDRSTLYDSCRAVRVTGESRTRFSAASRAETSLTTYNLSESAESWPVDTSPQTREVRNPCTAGSILPTCLPIGRERGSVTGSPE